MSFYLEDGFFRCVTNSHYKKPPPEVSCNIFDIDGDIWIGDTHHSKLEDYFEDDLYPTETEMIMFELETGFVYPVALVREMKGHWPTLELLKGKAAGLLNKFGTL